MNIILTKNFDKADIYTVRHGDCDKLSKHAGEELTVNGYAIYEDVDREGEVRKIAAMKTNAGFMATNSATFVDHFRDAAELLGDVTKIRVVKKTSRNGREYTAMELL